MARSRGNTIDDEVETIDDGTELVDTSTDSESGEKPAKAKKEPARGQLPDGYVTPVGLATALSQPKDGDAENTSDDNFYHTSKNGDHTVAPQMVYSYMRNAKKDNPFPIETVTDSLGKERQAVQLQAGLDWWEAKNSRVAERRANAANKASAKAERAANKSTEAEPATVTEAE